MSHESRGKLAAIFPNSSLERTSQPRQKICNETQDNERHGQHSRPLHFSITENEIRIKLEISLKC